LATIVLYLPLEVYISGKKLMHIFFSDTYCVMYIKANTMFTSCYYRMELSVSMYPLPF